MNGKTRMTALLAVLALLIALPVQAAAAGRIDLSRPVSLTVSHSYDGMPLPGVEFTAYLVATVEDSGELSVCGDFRAHQLDIRGENDQAWAEMAVLLAQGVQTMQTEAAAVVQTDENGAAVFTDLQQGLYLIMGESCVKDCYVYSVVPFLVMLPSIDMEENVWRYEVDASVKPEKNPQLLDYQVIKVWEDTEADRRPGSVVFWLYCDGEIVDEISLPVNGRWEYTWTGLDASHNWWVEEEFVADYTAEVERDGTTFIVTNTYQTPPPPTLPQTGQLWWPVPVLLAAGLLLVAVGLIRRRGGEDA